MKTDERLNFAFLCDLAFTDESKKLSIIGIFQNIHSNKVPVQHPQMYVVFGLKLEGPKEYTATLKIIKSSDSFEVIQPMDLKMNVTDKGKQDVIAIAKITNMKLPDFGNYDVNLFINSEPIGSLELTLIEKK